MGCFDNYIGILDTDTASTNLYYRHLGLSRSEAAGTSNDHYANGELMLRDVLARTIEFVKSDVKQYLYPYFRFNTIIDEWSCGKFDFGNYLGAAAANKGMKITLNVQNSRFSKLYIKQVRLLSDITVASVNVHIIDGDQTTTKAVSVTANIPATLELAYKCKAREVYVLWNTTAINPCSVDIENRSSYFTVNGWDGGIASDGYGLIPDVSVICDEEELMCMIASAIAVPILNKFGAELMHEAQYSDRINYYTLTEDQYKEKEDYFLAKYDKAMETFAKSVPLLLCNIDRYCVQCNSASQYVESM